MYFGLTGETGRNNMFGLTCCSLDIWDFSACLYCQFWLISDSDWGPKSLICVPTVKCAGLPQNSVHVCFSTNLCFHGVSVRVAGLWQAESTCPVWHFAETALALSCRLCSMQEFQSPFRWCVCAGAVRTTCFMWKKHCWICSFQNHCKEIPLHYNRMTFFCMYGKKISIYIYI